MNTNTDTQSAVATEGVQGEVATEQLDAVTVGEDGLTDAGRDMLTKVHNLREKLMAELKGVDLFVAIAAMLDLVYFQAVSQAHSTEVRATIVSLMVDQSQQASAALTSGVTDFGAGEQPQILVSAAG